MSLTHNPLVMPPPRYIVAELRRENDSLRAEVRELKVALMREEERNNTIERGAQQLRSILQPLYGALQHVFGEISAMGVEATAGQESTSKHSAVWDSWKEKLGGKDSFAGRMIDALLQHGALTSKQIAIHIGTKRMQTVYETTLKVNRAGLLEKNGDKFSLKQI